MSYARFGDDSDVYVYRSDDLWTCCGCIPATFSSLDELEAHLREHVDAGYKVPQFAFDRIAFERSTGTDLISGRTSSVDGQ